MRPPSYIGNLMLGNASGGASCLGPCVVGMHGLCECSTAAGTPSLVVGHAHVPPYVTTLTGCAQLRPTTTGATSAVDSLCNISNLCITVEHGWNVLLLDMVGMFCCSMHTMNAYEWSCCTSPLGNHAHCLNWAEKPFIVLRAALTVTLRRVS